MLEQRIQQQFFECADLLGQAAGSLGRPISVLAEAVFGCVTGGGKVLVAGSDAGSMLARLLAANLAGRFERERPPLAALALRHDALQGLAPQVQALGQPGDLLFRVTETHLLMLHCLCDAVDLQLMGELETA
jgi:D-sedoheptulose 7-phosphate isomerase